MSPVVRPFISEESIQERLQEMALKLKGRFDLEQRVVVIGLLKGAAFFMTDLVRALARHGLKLDLDYMSLSSYGSGTSSSGVVKVRLDCREDLEGAQVLLLDDILDTGNTLTFALDHLKSRGAEKMVTAVLLDKPDRRQVSVTADMVGFTIPNHFVVGYGIDYAEHYRELPYVGILEGVQ